MKRKATAGHGMTGDEMREQASRTCSQVHPLHPATPTLPTQGSRWPEREGKEEEERRKKARIRWWEQRVNDSANERAGKSTGGALKQCSYGCGVAMVMTMSVGCWQRQTRVVVMTMTTMS